MFHGEPENRPVLRTHEVSHRRKLASYHCVGVTDSDKAAERARCVVLIRTPAAGPPPPPSSPLCSPLRAFCFDRIVRYVHLTALKDSLTVWMFVIRFGR